ncbi:MAG: hypothetical protein MK089_10100, partial [Phycisphaerales bacterium]|nr:hypothetical protein [Phycisphaerales bacterium]
MFHRCGVLARMALEKPVYQGEVLKTFLEPTWGWLRCAVGDISSSLHDELEVLSESGMELSGWRERL